MADKPKVDRTKYMVANQTNQTVIKHYGEVNGCDFKIRKNANCTIYILDHCSGMYIDECVDCKIITGPIDSSIFIRTCKNCTVSTIAKQVRFRDSENVKVFTYCPSDPAVESSFNIAFAPFNAFFPHLKELFLKSKFNSSEPNHIKTPYDFTADKVYGNGARHFFQLPEEEFCIEEVKDGDAPCEEMYEGYSQEEPFVSRKMAKTSMTNDNPIDFKSNDNEVGYNEDVNNFFSNPSIPVASTGVQNEKLGGQVMGSEGFEFSSNVPLSIPIDREDAFAFDEEESKRHLERQMENEERARVIREKIALELKMKNELREKATEYINNFNSARMKKIEDNQKNNLFNERQRLKEKEELSSFEGGKGNPWERISKLVELKESDYKGTKNVSRMRACLISRKGDFNQINLPK